MALAFIVSCGLHVPLVRALLDQGLGLVIHGLDASKDVKSFREQTVAWRFPTTSREAYRDVLSSQEVLHYCGHPLLSQSASLTLAIATVNLDVLNFPTICHSVIH